MKCVPAARPAKKFTSSNPSSKLSSNSGSASPVGMVGDSGVLRPRVARYFARGCLSLLMIPLSRSVVDTVEQSNGFEKWRRRKAGMIMYQNDPKGQREADPYKRSTKAGKRQPTHLPLQTKEGRTSQESRLLYSHPICWTARESPRRIHNFDLIGHRMWVLGSKMDGWCALKQLLGLGGPKLDVRGGAESRDAGVRGVSFSPGCGTEDLYVASNETCKCDRDSNNNSGGFFGSEGTDGAGGLMRSIRSESSCSPA